MFNLNLPQKYVQMKWQTNFLESSNRMIKIFNKNSAEGVIAPAGAKVTPGATIRMWLLNKFILFLAVLSWKTGLKKMRTKCLVGHIYSRPVPFPLMAISSALTFRIIQPNDNGTSK